MPKGHKPDCNCGVCKSIRGEPMSAKTRAKVSASLKKYYQEHPNPDGGKHSPEHIAAYIKSRNTPDVVAHIERYGLYFIGKLRIKYRCLDCRCNKPNDQAYKYYGGRGIQNKFTSFEHFLNHIIFDLGITTLEQIKGLEIHRKDNDSHYMPGNIEFLTRKEHHEKHHKRQFWNNPDKKE